MFRYTKEEAYYLFTSGAFMVKGKIKGKLLALICLTSIISVISCEIGMGAAVDVEAPTVDVSYPPENAIVRDTFMAAGQCKDDMEVSSVKVTLYNPESNITYGPYNAIVDSKANSWKVSLNQKSPGNVTSVFDSYKQWEFPDGNYIISAVATDVEGKNSPAASSPISIDNTAPVMIVSKPLAVGNSEPTVYGSYFKLSGDIAEEHQTQKLILNYKEYNNSTGSFTDANVRTLEIENADELSAMSSSNPLIIAKYGSVSSEQHQKYIDIYGSAVGDNKYYYAGFQLEDNALLYQNPGDSGSGRGNQTEQYYILNETLAVNYSLTPAKLMNILKGNSSDYSADQVSQIISKLSTPGFYASSTALTAAGADAQAMALSSRFSLNPHNNPTWSLGQEYGFSEGDTEVGQYMAGSSLVLTLKSGRDASYPDPRTVRVDLNDLDAGPEDASVIHLIGPEGLFATSWNESADDSTKNYTFVLNSDSVFTLDHNYQMFVTGTDRNKTDLEPEDGKSYLFKFTTSNSIPRITITSPADDRVFGKEINTTGDNPGVIITGYINTDSLPLSTTEPLKLIALDISEVTGGDVQRSIVNYDKNITFSAPAADTPHQYPFELKLTAKNSGENSVSGEFVPDSAEGKYLFIATLRAKDLHNEYGDKKIKFYVDNKAPDVSINDPSPVVEETNEGNLIKTVNGTVRISGNASDSGLQGTGLQALSYKVFEGNVAASYILEEHTPLLDGTIPLNESWSFNLETQRLEDPEYAATTDTSVEYTIGVIATDVLGNKKAAVKTIKVKQIKDRPSISFNNANESVTEANIANISQNRFGTESNNKLYAFVTDDDGLASVKVEYQKTAPVAGSRIELQPSTELSGNKKSYNPEYTLPSEQGEYKIFVEVRDSKDETNNAVYTNENDPFFITIDNGAPEFESVTITPAKNQNGYYQGSKTGSEKSITINGTVSDGNGLHATEGFTVKHYKKNGSDWQLDSSIDSAIEEAPQLSPVISSSFSDEIILPAADGDYKVEYTAKDKYGLAQTYTYEYKVDMTNPVIDHTVVNISQVEQERGWINSNNVSIEAYVTDAKSGVNKVEYTLDDEAIPDENKDWKLMTHADSASSTFEKWIASVQFYDGETKTLKFRVKDAVGNEETSESINVKVDKTKPVLDVKWYQISDGTEAGSSTYIKPSGTAYINSSNGKNLVIYANYTDTNADYGTDNSGVTAPVFKIGDTETVIPYDDPATAVVEGIQITYYKNNLPVTASAESIAGMPTANIVSEANEIKAYKAVIPPSVFENADNADIKVSGKDKAGNSIDNDDRVVITLVDDDTPPELGNPNIPQAYKASDGTYYLKRPKNADNTYEKLTISGTSTDNKSIDKTTISISGVGLAFGEGLTTYTKESTSTAWKFDDIDVSDWTDTAAATIELKAYDKAGNVSSTSTVTLKIDEKKPVVLTGKLPIGKTLDNHTISDEADISNPYISDYTLREKDAWKYGGISIGKGKYGDTTYGRESSIEVGITYIGEAGGSGVKKIEYKMFSSEKVPDELIDTKTGIFSGTIPSYDEEWPKAGDFAVSAAKYWYYGEDENNDAIGKNCFKGKATINGFTSTTGGQPNLLFVRAIDNCGNASDWFVLLIQMDNDNPTVTSADTNPISLLTNGKSDMTTLKGSVKDGYYSSGLKAIRLYVDGKLAIDGNFTKAPASGLLVDVVKKDGSTWSSTADTVWTGWSSTQKKLFNDAYKVTFKNEYGELTYSGYAPTEAELQSSSFVPDANTTKCSLKDAASYASWELTLKPQNSDSESANPYSNWFNLIKNKASPQIALEVEDWAEDSSGSGNKSYVQITTLDIDTVNPEVTLSNPVEGSLNGKQVIKGAVSENHTAAKVEIYYTTQQETTEDGEIVPPSALSSWTKLTELTENLYSFNAGEHNFNQLIGSAESGATLYVLAYVTDKAGNTGKTYKTYSVDKNSDRPVVKITSASITSNTEANPLLLGTATVNFTITDDDGVQEAEYRILRKTGSGDSVTYQEGAWTPVNLSASGEASVKFNNDGDHKLEFRVKDKENPDRWFTSTDSDQFKRIYLKDSASYAPSYGADPVFYVTVETKIPELAIEAIQLLSTATEAQPDTAWISSGFYNYVVGGSGRKYIKVKVRASDEGTGINNIKISATIGGENITLTGEDITRATKTEAAEDGFYYVTIPCTKAGLASENINFVATVTAEDNVGKNHAESIALKADTKSPDIIITAPEGAASGSHLSGTIIAEGQLTESAKLYYAISPLEASPDTYTASTLFSYRKYNDSNEEVAGGSLSSTDYTDCLYKPMNAVKPEETKLSFYLSFDGNTDSTGATLHSDTLSKWIQKIGITTEEALRNPLDPFDEVVKLYIHVKAVDSAENTNEVCYPIIFEPLGSRPEVSIGYPSAEQAGEGHELTLGGAPSIIGTATGTNIADYVWLQVDCDESGTWTAADFNILAALNDSENEPLYQLGRMDTKALVREIEAGTEVGFYAIRVPLNGLNWTQQINLGGELNPPEGSANTTKPVKLWTYATDEAGFISRREIRNLIIDSQAPVIDPEIRLVKWNAGFNGGNGFTADASGAITFTDGAVASIRPYNENDNIKGKWYVIGKVSDESGIKTVSYKVNGGELVRAITSNDAAYTDAETGTYIRKITGGNYIFCLPIGDETEDTVGQYSIDFSAEEIEDTNPKSAERSFTVCFDNKAPVIGKQLTGYASGAITSENPLTIVNSNGVFTFGGLAKEDKVGTIDQTGIERVAFYFTRNITGQETKIFDSMIRNGRTGNAVDYSALAHEQGLYWQTANVNTSGHTITVSSGLSANAFKNIHKGGLVKINNLVYRISEVNEAAGTVILSNDDVLLTASGVTAKFAIANVVDNSTREGEGSTGIYTDYGYGYYSNGSFDDGDLMVESLIQEGTEYTWEANINSKNISDGPATLHYVVFDKAGNYTEEQTIECFVKNNQPRLAGLIIGTDQNGNSIVDENEMESSFSNIYAAGYDGKKKIDSLTVPANAKDEKAYSAIKIKGKTVIKPEIVGGNGRIGYTYSVAKRKTSVNAGGQTVDARDGWDNPYKTPVTSENIKELGTGTADDDTQTVSLAGGGIVIDVKDFLQNGIVDGENQKFTFTIWDSTPGRNYGTNSQYAVLNVVMDVALNDEVAAKNKIIPFYWKDTENNSLKDNSKENGHIELSKDLPSTISSRSPKVSGAVKLEGIAQDDTLLESLSVIIDGSLYQIAAYSAGSWEEKSNTGWTAEIREATYAEFIAAGFITEADIPYDKEETDSLPYTSQEFGHVVHWTMNIDTETMGITPKTGIEISASALDKGKPTLTGSGETAVVSYTSNNFRFNGGQDATLAAVAQTGGNDGSGDHTCKYTIDVVPYITKIITRLSKKSTKDDTSEYDRTALGHYPVASTETIKIQGFNLTGVSSSTIKFTSKDNSAAEVSYTSEVAANGFTIPSNAKSGKLSIVVDGVESLNNSNNNDANGSYTEAKPAVEDFGEDDTHEIFSNYYNCRPNEENNYILTDDVELDIWEFNSQCAVPNPAGRIDEAILKINPVSGIMGFAFLSGSMSATAPYGNNNSYKDVGTTGSTGDARTTAALAYDSRGWSYSMEAGGNEGDRVIFRAVDASGNQNWSTKFEYTKQNGKRSDNYLVGNADGTLAYETNSETGEIVLNDDGTPKPKRPSVVNLRYKVRSPSIATSPLGTNNSNIYLAYYDSYNDEIRFMSGENNTNSGKRGILVDRSRDGYTCKNAQVIATNPNTNLPTGANALGNEAEYQYTGSPLGGAGEFVCIDVIPANTTVNGTALAKDVVVIVWYETATGNLLYSYNTNPRDLSWRSNNTSINEHYRGLNRENWEDAKTIFTHAGEYCKIAVDGRGGIHIAAYDIKSHDLRYAYLPAYNSEYDEDTMSYTVDSAGEAGTHLTLDVALEGEDLNPVPYISYVGANMPKVAYLKAPLTTSTLTDGTSSDMFTGSWEVSYIPMPITSTMPNLDTKRLEKRLDNRINVAVWKKTDQTANLKGVLDNSKTGTSSAGTTSGTCWGNGTANPVVAYSIIYDTSNDSIESAQKR